MGVVVVGLCSTLKAAPFEACDFKASGKRARFQFRKEGLSPGQSQDAASSWFVFRYGGLAELIVNAMVDVKPGFLEWEWH